MTKGRVKFAVAGVHPLLYYVRDYFIQKLGLMLVPWEETPDFALIGAEPPKDALLNLEQVDHIQNSVDQVPVFLLSSSSVYTEPAKIKVFAGPGCSLPDPTWDYSSQALFAAAAEHAVASRSAPSLVVRTFGVYGPDIPTSSVISSFIKAAQQQEPLTIHGAGYQTRSFIHQDDFCGHLEGLISALLAGNTGYVNLGSDEEASILKLAKYIWQLTNPQDVDTLVQHVPKKTRQYLVPNTQYLISLSKYLPKMSLRKGLWTLIGA